MALKFGELFAVLRADDKPLEQGLKSGESKVKASGEAIKKGLAVAGGAAGAMLTAGIAQNLSLEAPRQKLAAELGLSKEDSAKIGAVAGKVYADNWGESLGDVNDAIKAVNDNLGNVTRMGADDLRKVTEAGLALSQTFNVDVADSSRAAGQLIRNGLAKNSTEAFDILTRGFQLGLDKSGDFLDTINEYSPQFAKLGIDGPHALTLIRAGLQGGARDTDSIADAFKEFSLRAIDGSSTTAAGYKAIGLDAKQAAAEIGKGGPAAQQMTMTVLQRLAAMKDPIKQNAAGVALFGTQWEDTLRKALPQVAKAEEGMEGVKGAAQKMADTVGDTAGNKVESLKRGMEQWVQGLTNGQSVIGGMTAAVVAFGGPALAMAGTAGQIAAGLAAVNLEATIAAVKSGVAAAASGVWTAAQWLLNAALNANPIGLVVIAIAALVAGFIYAWKNSETFRSIVIGAWHAIQGAASAVFGWIGSFISGTWHAVSAVGSMVLAGIVAYVRFYVNTVLAVVRGIVAVVTFFRDAFNNAKNAAVAKGAELIGWVGGLGGRIKGALGNLGGLLYDAGRGIISGLVDGIRSMASAPVDAMRGIVGGIRNLLPGSPVKEGPLRVLNRGYAGGQIVSMVADGMDAKAYRPRESFVNAVGAIPAPRAGGAGANGAVPGQTGSGRQDLYLHGPREVVGFVKSLVRDFGGGSVVAAFEG